MKAARPNWRISWLINTEWAPLVAGNPALDEVVLFPRRTFRGLMGLGAFRAWVKNEVRTLQPDLALDFQGLLRTAFIAKFSGAKTILGLDNAREGAGWFYDRKARVPRGVPHAVERYIALARLALEGGAAASPPRLQYALPPGTPPEDAADFASGNYVLLHPFSRGIGKSLTVAQVERFCRRLAPERKVIIVGRAREAARLDLPPGCTNCLNRTSLNELIWLIRHASFVVSVDSGPMHLAAALGRPLVSIHTWSDPRKVGPYREDAWVWKSGRLFQFAQRHDLQEGFYELPPSRLRESDLEEIASLAIKASSEYA